MDAAERKNVLVVLGYILGGIALCLVVSFVRFEIKRRAKFIDVELDRRIAEDISALVESELRSSIANDADFAQWGELRSWVPERWYRGGPVWMGAAEANSRLGIDGVAHFEKADIPVQITILHGPKRLTIKRASDRVIPVISGGAAHPDFVHGPPYRDEIFPRPR